MSNAAHWFEQGLGARIDAVEAALNALREDDDAAHTTLRNLARSLAGPAAMYGYTSVRQAAQAVDAAGEASLTEAAETLIATLRREAGKTHQSINHVLLVGGDAAFNKPIVAALRTPHRDVTAVATAGEALSALQQRDFAFIVLNLFLPDIDGRAFLLRLREDAMLTSLPVLIVAPDLTDEVREEARVLDADILLESPPDPAAVAQRVKVSLRRSRESVKAARRDPLTGLLNRAALRAAFEQATREARGTDEPAALAVLSVDAPRTTLDGHGPQARDAVLQRIGSILSTALRSTDIIGRWGPCEFAALFPGEDPFGGGRAVEKVVDAVRNEAFTAPDGTRIAITVSAGVTPVSPGKGIDDALSDADRFLFQATAAGGDRVMSSRSPHAQRPERVLLVMSEAVTSRVLRNLFESDGFQVQHIEQVDGGIAPLLEGQRYHLIVVDEDLPGKGGFEVLRELRALPRNSRTPIIMLIARNAERSMARALELGANDYMMRPFSPFTFMRRMRRVLKRGIEAAQPAAGSEICRILVVDPDVRALLLAASALHERGGFRPYLAARSAEARRRLAEEQPDAVLVDVDSDDAELQQFALDVVASTNPSAPAVLLTTGARSEAFLDKYAGPVLRGTLQKPFDILSLGEQVERLLSLSPSARQSPDAAAHLNREIQRITDRDRPAVS